MEPALLMFFSGPWVIKPDIGGIPDRKQEIIQRGMEISSSGDIVTMQV